MEEEQQQLRKTVLLVKTQATKSLTAVETFLRNRDWQIISVTDVKDALKILVEQKPSFVMISIDHPDRKVRAFPKLLVQAFPVHVIVFAESTKSSSFKALQDTGLPYRINPPMTGPAVERMVNKIIRDLDAQNRIAAVQGAALAANQERAEYNKSVGDAARQGNIIRTGQQEAKTATTHMIHGATTEQNRAFSDDAASQLWSQMSANADPDLAAEAGSWMDGGSPGTISGLGSRSNDRNSDSSAGFLSGGGSLGESSFGDFAAGALAPAYPGQLGKAESHAAGEVGGLLNGESVGYLLGTNEQPRRPDGSGENETGGALGGFGQGSSFRQDQPMASYSEEDVIDSGSAVAAAVLPRFDQAEGMGAALPQFQETDSSGSLGSVLNGVNSARLTKSQITSGQTGSDSIIVRGTQKALDESVVFKEDAPKEKLTSSSNVACLIIESAKFSGFLVAAMGKNRKMDDSFVDTIKVRLGKFLRENGEPIEEGGGSMGLKIKPVDFEDWALEYADFLRKSIHEGQEIAMAFFPFADAKTEMADSAQADMGAVSIDEFQADVSVEFNVYVYLPSNKKYILYTPRGSKLYKDQKTRLSDRGMTHLHVRRTELQNVSKYRAQNYLNSKIEEFQRKAAKQIS